jgi:hypothetical protein
MAVMKDGHAAELSVFASEGVTDLTAATVTNQAVRRCVLQVTGTALQISIDTMLNFMEALLARTPEYSL